mgnify:CR=1 FL=1
MVDGLMPMMQMLLASTGKSMPDWGSLPGGDMFIPTTAYDPASRPSPHTSPLARFFTTNNRAPSSSLPLQRAVREARCEVKSDGICSPYQLLVSPTQAFVSAAGGWKNRDPILHIYDNSLDANDSPSVGLADTPSAMALDGVDDLVAIADRSRIKTYRGSLAVHTMNSSAYDGALAFFDGGTKLARASATGPRVAIWDLEGLETHGADGSSRVGGKIRSSELNSEYPIWLQLLFRAQGADGPLPGMRDNDGGDEIERSSGSSSTSTLTLDASIHGISSWTPLAGTPNFICASSAMLGSSTETFELDWTTGKKRMQYFGHGGTVTGLSTAEGRENEFITTCSDGATRLFDR